MDIRIANNADCHNVQALIFNVLEEFGLDYDRQSIDKDLYDIDSFYNSAGGRFWVVEAQGKIVATAGLLKISASECEFRKMYILPEFRRRGLGRKLVELSLNQARQSGFKRVVLETARPLVTAIALYKKIGFTEYQPDNLSCRCDQALELTL